MIEKRNVTLKNKEPESMTQKKKKYESPVLSKVGAIHKVTLNGSSAVGDSQTGLVETNP